MIAAPFEKTYLSRAQSRIWSMDNPVGDPFGGPAYGQKEEPVSMIAAVVSIGVGASAVGAAVTAGALTLSAVMGGLMIAGGAASLIGTVSGNKKLAMIGGIVAGVGGLGLAGANLFTEAAATSVTAESLGSSAMGGQGAATVGAEGGLGGGYAEAILPGEEFAGSAAYTTTAGPVSNTAFQTPSAAFDPSTILKGSFGSGSATAVPGAAPDLVGIDPNVEGGLINSALDTSRAGEVANMATSEQFANELGNQINLASGNALQPSPYEALADASGNTQLVPKAMPGTDMSKYINDPNYLEALNGTPNAGIAQQQTAGSASLRLAGNGDYGVTNNTGAVLDSNGNYLGQAPGLGVAGKPTVYGAINTGEGGGTSSWLDKIEGIAKGIEKYKTTAKIGGDLINGAMKYAIPSQTDQAAIDLYKAKANLANQEAAAIASLEERKRRQNEAVKNLKPIQLNNSMNPIFGNALNGAGIINSARA